LLNVEAEHMDFYGSDENLDAAFRQFAANLPDDGFMVVCAENARAMKAADGAKCKVSTYAVADSGTDAEFTASDIVYHPDSAEYTLCRKGCAVIRITLKTPGRHNVSNSVAAAAAAIALGISPEDIAAGLNKFEGTGRRFEKVGSVKGALLIDDYAHHPTEVQATLEAARGITPAGNRVISVFQVHTFTRAIQFRDQFTEALRQSDEIVVTNIFAAREQDPGTVSGLTLTKHFKEHGLNALFISNFDDIADYIYYRVKPGDTVISLGAGDVNKVLHKLIKRAEMDE
ncbi:MAG: UDP-N-acetylmuramate--L-alanine ligase, partial [Clostridia bacterium]|nr:UDP-N-acetylmuramate--L-alanine ligase [Clostridia bacterium]